MRDHTIVEIVIRELAQHCAFADMAYKEIERTLDQEASRTFFTIHSFLAHCGTVVRLLSSERLARFADGRTIAQVIGVPHQHHLGDEAVREILVDYDARLAKGLASTGEVAKVLDDNIGDRDAFEEDASIFLRHYDPTVKVLTLMEVELPLALLSAEIAEVMSLSRRWLALNAELVERPATVSIPPSA